MSTATTATRDRGPLTGTDMHLSLRHEHGAARRRRRRRRRHHHRGDRTVRVRASRRCCGCSTGCTNPTRATSCSTAGRCCKDNPDQLRQRIGMVFQQFNLFPHRTVLDNVDARTAQAQRAGARTQARDARPGAARASRAAAQGGGPARQPVRRPAAAGRDRPGPGDDAAGHVLRRGDLRAGPGTGQGRPGADGRPRQRTA